MVAAMPSHPHDRLFRRTFSNPSCHRGAAPAEVVAALDLARLELVNGASFIDEALEERQVDLLYTVPLAGLETRAFVYVLFEHQSSVGLPHAGAPARVHGAHLGPVDAGASER